MSCTRPGRGPYLVLAAVVALSVSGCSSTTSATTAKAGSSSSAGVTGSSVAALFQRLRSSGAAAKSVRIKGVITNGSITNKAVKVQVDIAGDRAGKSTRAILNDGTGAIEILVAGGRTYIKADTAYWIKNGTPAIAKLASGKYLKVPVGSAAGTGIPTVGKLLDQIFVTNLSAADKLNTKVDKADVNGVPAYLMTTKADDTKIFVSADAQTRLLRVVGSKGQSTLLDFTQWDAVAPTSPPPADQLAKIAGS